jgi:uncharacterized protein (DUF1697 family)
MKPYVAGHAKVKMVDLKQAFTEAGCEDVRSYIQSGNVLFKAPAGSTADLFEKIQKKLLDLLGTEATVMYRTHRNIADIMKSDPFKDVKTGPDIKLYVSFLSGKPRHKPALPLLQPKEALEAIKVIGQNVYIVSRKKKNGGYGFPNIFLEKAFGVPATTRNWTTVTKIAGLMTE